MSRLAADRKTHLTPDEIVTEALRQFDAGPNEPTIRSLAGALGVAPAAIYHHFRSQAAIWQVAVERVWDEALVELLRLVPDPFSAEPVEALVAVGLATRRAWLAHHRLSRYMAATPGGTQFRSDAISLMAPLLERLGLTGEEAGVAFHNYATFMVGAVLYAADNRTANEQLDDEGDPKSRFSSPPEGAWTEHSSDGTRLALETVTDVSIADPARDEELFLHGMRRLVDSLMTRRPGSPRRGRGGGEQKV
jgi:AcrR family transcriptional regulator